eukprot:SAG22_NODE_4828_length_1156_cov_0.875118_1_plen_161_part_00
MKVSPPCREPSPPPALLATHMAAGSLVWLPALSISTSSSNAAPLFAMFITLPLATIDVAKSKTIGPPPGPSPGMPHVYGLVVSRASAPPYGATSGSMPVPLVYSVLTSPNSFAAISAYVPTRPMWWQPLSISTQTPCCLATSQASSVASRAATIPNPPVS